MWKSGHLKFAIRGKRTQESEQSAPTRRPFVKYAFIILSPALLLYLIFLPYARGPVDVTGNAFEAGHGAFEIDVELVRSLATAEEQEDRFALPLRVEKLTVGSYELPAWWLYSVRRSEGPGLESLPDRLSLSMTSFLLRYERQNLIIDPASDERLFQSRIGALEYDRAAYERLQRRMRRASWIVATEEEFDHLGVARSTHLYDIRDRIVLTGEQMKSDLIKTARFPPAVLEVIQPLRYDRYHRLAPGVVLIKAPGHSHGSQMIYVQLRDRTEFLFVGDVAYTMSAILEQWSPPRFVVWFSDADLSAIHYQLEDLYRIHRQGSIQIIPAHDTNRHDDLVRAGLIVNLN